MKKKGRSQEATIMQGRKAQDKGRDKRGQKEEVRDMRQIRKIIKKSNRTRYETKITKGITKYK